MKFVYSPAGAEPREWPYEPGRLMSPEAEAIERVTGMDFGEWRRAVERESVLALHALLWVLLRRDNPSLEFGQVQFCMDEVGVAFEARERHAIRTRLRQAAKSGALDSGSLAFLAALEADEEINELGLDDDPDSEPDPSADAGEAESAAGKAGTGAD